MGDTYQSAFLRHRDAFAAMRAGHLQEGAAHFHAALAGFADLLTDAAWHADLLDRARRIPGRLDPEALVKDFLKYWPRWLLDLHFERTLSAARSGDLSLARVHWQVLVSAEPLAVHLGEDTLRLYRDRLTREYLQGSEPGHNLEEETEERRLALFQSAQRLLAIDAGIERARLLAMRICVIQIRELLRDKYEERQKRKRGTKDAPLMRAMSKSGRRTRFRIRRLSRVLSRHLRVLARQGCSDPVELVDGYKALVAYLGISDRDQALRVLRRGRRIAPADRELRAMFRALR